MTKRLGLYDTVENIWFGGEKNDGPRLFSPEDLFPPESHRAGERMGEAALFIARTAAMVIDKQLGHPPGRTQARVFPETSVRLRDEVPTKMTPREALARLEDGDL